MGFLEGLHLRRSFHLRRICDDGLGRLHRPGTIHLQSCLPRYVCTICSLDPILTLAGIPNSAYAWQTLGNAISFISGLIAALLYGNIGIKVFYASVLRDVFHMPPLDHRVGKYAWVVIGKHDHHYSRNNKLISVKSQSIGVSLSSSLVPFLRLPTSRPLSVLPAFCNSATRSHQSSSWATTVRKTPSYLKSFLILLLDRYPIVSTAESRDGCVVTARSSCSTRLMSFTSLPPWLLLDSVSTHRSSACTRLSLALRLHLSLVRIQLVKRVSVNDRTIAG